ncbi:hypothetical protein Mal4_43670 [Maioricimonas rarisocia]|uniref:DUF4350 domain-containing protein n=1 Tax=Maioricimonas rarisocia TaxID=2528026 RepID=A0A517ZBY9_9PLAN|nr:hypothetical protein [Maioricimonas rarisocia]QDU40013.1 hypothetical protein Mal4_43670 [Maioricimonas rarisocia]
MNKADSASFAGGDCESRSTEVRPQNVRRQAIPLLIALCLWILTPAVSLAHADKLTVDNVTVGFSGTCRVGEWTPIAVDVTGPAGLSVSLRVTVPDADGNPAISTFGPATLDGHEPRTIVGTIKPGQLQSEARIEIVAEPTVLASETVAISALPHSTRLWAIPDEIPGFVDAADSLNARRAPSDAPAVRLLDVSDVGQWPAAPYAWASLDVIVLRGSTTVSPAHSKMLRRWVHEGGRLILLIGSESEAYLEGPLAEWVPIEVSGQLELRDLGMLRPLVPRSGTIRIRNPVSAAQLNLPAGQILAPGNNGPLLARAPFGFGSCTISAVDLHDGPLARWDGLVDLSLLMAETDADNTAALTQSDSEIALTGVSHLLTQVISSVDRFDSVAARSHWEVIGWLLLYLLLVGPIDYLLVHRLLRRPHWTWVTLPCWVVAGAVGGTILAQNSNASTVEARQLDVWDIDTASGRSRLRSWVSIFSPETRRYEVAFAPNNAVGLNSGSNDAGRIAWAAPAEEGFRGQYRSGGLQLGRPSYRYSPEGQAIENLPLNVWSSKVLTADWAGAPAPQTDWIASDLVDDGTGRLQGTLTHHLPGPIEEWFLAYGNTVYLPEENRETGETLPLEPDALWQPGGAIRSRMLKGFLTGVTLALVKRQEGTGEDVVRNRESYDPLERDPYRIVRMLSFYENAGGADYAGLSNDAVRQLDLSHLLDLQRAILFGRIDRTAATYTIDGESAGDDARETFVRIVLPVRRAVATD